MTRILIDGDILPYELGYVMEKDGTAEWPVVASAVDNRLAQIVGAIKARLEVSEVVYTVYLSDPKKNFRKPLASILPYKGNRSPKERPYHWDGIRAYLRDKHGAQSFPKLEGDDLLLMDRKPGEVIASTDKDLRQSEGVYYSWARGKIPERWDSISPLAAKQNLWAQMLVGDRTDNILGLFGVGPASQSVKKVLTTNNERDMAEYVGFEYYRRFGDWWSMFFMEHFTLLKLVEDAVFKEKPEEYAVDYIEKLVGGMEWLTKKPGSKQEAENGLVSITPDSE